MATVAIWLFFDIGVIYELIPGFVFSGIAIILVSLLTEEPPEEVKQEFQDATGATGLRVEPSDEVGAPGDD
jgi:sodium/proline symporter